MASSQLDLFVADVIDKCIAAAVDDPAAPRLAWACQAISPIQAALAARGAHVLSDRSIRLRLNKHAIQLRTDRTHRVMAVSEAALHTVVRSLGLPVQDVQVPLFADTTPAPEPLSPAQKLEMGEPFITVAVLLPHLLQRMRQAGLRLPSRFKSDALLHPNSAEVAPHRRAVPRSCLPAVLRDFGLIGGVVAIAKQHPWGKAAAK